MQPYILRPYQLAAVERTLYGLQHYRKPFIIQAATGAGKSLIIAETCRRLNEPVLILQPSKEILDQNYQKLISYDHDIEAGIYSASFKSKEIAKYTFATIGSIYKQPDRFQHFKYVLVDECHLVDPQNITGMLNSFLRAIGCQAVGGLTATPYRIASTYYTDADGNTWYTAHLKMINRLYPYFFKQILFKIETADLISQGFLCPITYYYEPTDTSDLQVNSTGREFTDDSLERFWNQHRLRRIAQAVAFAQGNHRRSLTFCSSIRQATNVLKLLDAMGIKAGLVTGKTPPKEREGVVAAYRQGKLTHLLNVGVFTVGFDIPELDCIIMARPTMSLGLWYQIVGRGVRIDPNAPKKILHVYDLAGVVERLGKVEDIRVKTEAGGFRDEVWSGNRRKDNQPLFKWFVKEKTAS